MTKTTSQRIYEEALNAVVEMGGDFVHWNYILAMYGLKSIL